MLAKSDSFKQRTKSKHTKRSTETQGPSVKKPIESFFRLHLIRKENVWESFAARNKEYQGRKNEIILFFLSSEAVWTSLPYIKVLNS